MNMARAFIRGRAAAVVLIVLASASSVPANALPLSRPSVSMRVGGGSDDNSRVVTVSISSSNGTVTHASLCAPDAGGCVTRDFNGDQTTLTSVQQCALGDNEGFSIELHFPGPGTYRVTAEATSTGCPVIGTDQSGSASQDIVIAAPPPPPPPPPPIPCADQATPTATDTGVTDTSVALGSTVIESGPLAAYARDGRAGIRAAVADINRSGGICGRMLTLELQDDGGDPQTARADVHAMAERDFALVGMPDPPGLQAASSSGDIDSLGIPVVGTTGYSASEFSDPSIWSVGGAPDVFASVIVAHAYDQGARKFGIVTNTSVAWLAAAREATLAAIQAHDGTSVGSDTSIDGGATSYTDDITSFNQGCADGCDAVIYLLDPAALLDWMTGSPARGTIENDLPQFDLTRDLANDCQSACDQMIAWDPFRLPIAPAPTKQYVQSIAYTDPNADAYNPITEAAYVGTYLTARAMAAAGTDLTRAALKQILDSQSFTDPLAPSAFAWGLQREPNRCLHGYQIEYKGTFAGWRDSSTGWLCS